MKHICFYKTWNNYPKKISYTEWEKDFVLKSGKELNKHAPLKLK